MEKFRKIWEPVLQSFKWAYPHYYEDMTDWFPSGYAEITVKTKDGLRLVYEQIGDYIRFVRDADYDLEDFNEVGWRDNFAHGLKTRMRKVGISRDKLSELTGISTVTITKYTNGEASPSGYNIERIARALRCSTAELTNKLI